MRQIFKTFDASGYPSPKWLPGFLDNCFAKPKELPIWDARKPDQLERLVALAGGIKKFLEQLPDGAEIGTTELAKCLHPERYEDTDFTHFLINRIERVRFARMIDDHFYTLPDNRWKKQRTFYKYHNGNGKTVAATEGLPL